MNPDQKVEELNLILPGTLELPPDTRLPFSWVRVRGNRAFISRHCALNADGSLYGLIGKVGADLSIEQGYQAARHTALAMLGSLKRELGTMDRITAWLRVFGMVNVAPGFEQTPSVINGFSGLIIEIFGEERGDHTRSAVGLAELPFNVPVKIEAEVEITP